MMGLATLYLDRDDMEEAERYFASGAGALRPARA